MFSLRVSSKTARREIFGTVSQEMSTHPVLVAYSGPCLVRLDQIEATGCGALGGVLSCLTSSRIHGPMLVLGCLSHVMVILLSVI